MSLAKLNHIKRVRKPGKCEKCGVEIKVGDPAVRYAVGFRGATRTRCAKHECLPKPSERESSLVADLYAAQEEADVDGAGSLEGTAPDPRRRGVRGPGSRRAVRGQRDVRHEP